MRCLQISHLGAENDAVGFHESPQMLNGFMTDDMNVRRRRLFESLNGLGVSLHTRTRQ